MPTSKPLRELVPDIVTHIQAHRQYLEYNNRLMLVFEGQLRKEIEDSLQVELSPESYRKAIKRVPSINLLVRIVDKLSRVYCEPAMRTTEKEEDLKLVRYYESKANIDDALTSANKMLNLHKCVALEPFADDGTPSIRVIPAHQFLVFSDNPVNPLRPTVFIKIMNREQKNIQHVDRDGRKVKPDETREVEVYYLYSDDEFLIIDSDGSVREDKMEASGNPEGVNPVGVMPFVYVNRSDFRLIPVPDTDTLDNTVLIPKLLADLNYAVQFQSHSIVTAIDLDLPADVKMSPDSVWVFKSNEEGKQGRVDSIKPSVDIEKVLMLIQSTLSLWLESRNIKAGALGEISAANAASGIAKIIDESDATQDRQAQCGKFAVAEKQLWSLLTEMHAYWAASGQVEERKLFSDKAEVVTQFPDQMPIQSEAGRIREASDMLTAGLLTKRQAIKKIYPHLDEKTLDAWVAALKEEADTAPQEVPNAGQDAGPQAAIGEDVTGREGQSAPNGGRGANSSSDQGEN